MDSNSEVVYLYLDDIIPNRFQPREVFDDQALKELAVSIKEHGVIQPIIVRKVENKYEIIAGERRYKASTMAGLTKIPAIVKNLDDKESSKVALIENLQRKDLSPIEEARTYQKILELEENMTQEELAGTMGKTQSSVSNKLRLLELPEEIQDALLKEKISERHARSLLTIENKNDQIKMMDKVISEKMTVRELDKEIKALKEGLDAPVVETPAVEPQPVEPQPAVESQEDKNPLENVELPKPNLDSFLSPSAPEEKNDAESSDTDSSKLFILKDDLDNKFVPQSDEEKTDEVKNEATGEYNNMFNTNLDTEPNTSVASNMSLDEVVVPAKTSIKDIIKAITMVKNTITNLQNDGYKISFDEDDNDNQYKVSIKIDKN